MSRRACPAARAILRELAADIARARYARAPRGRRLVRWLAMRDATTAALRGGR